MDCLLASCAGEIKFWQLKGGGGGGAPSYSPGQQFTPHKGSVTSMRWNHNNQVLVSCGSDGEVCLSHYTGSELGRLPTTNRSALTSLAFSQGSRFLCTGGASQIVELWDLKKKEKTREFTGHNGGVTAIVFGKGDARVASSSLAGDIIVHSVVTGAEVARVKHASGATIRDIHYSNFNQNLLCSCGDDKAVYLWDTNTGQEGGSFLNVHKDAVQQVRFNPVSPAVMCSVGLDKSLNLYDLRKKQLVKQIVADHPLSCFDIYAEGTIIAVGTVGGHLLAYDLRKGDAPTHKIMAAHTSSTGGQTTVNSVQLQFPQQKGGDGGSPGMMSSPGMPNASPLSSSSSSSSSSSDAAKRPSLTPQSPTNNLGSSSSSGGGGSSVINNSNNAQYSLSPAPRGDLSGSSSSSGGQQQGGGGGGMVVPADIIKSAVEDALADFRVQMKQDINNMHLELLRQFHVQQVELDEMLTNFTSKYESLVEEVKQLRHDYEQLRHTY